jgi:hypothetical protein
MRDDDIADVLRRMSDRIANMILHCDIEWIDVLVETEAMREVCRQYAPDRLDLFEMIYPPRFERLWNDFGPPTRLREF